MPNNNANQSAQDATNKIMPNDPVLLDQTLGWIENEPSVQVEAELSVRGSLDPENTTLTYEIVGDPGIFVIDPESGLITLADGGTLDYETDQTSYTLTVQVTETGSNGQSFTTYATVSIDLLDVNEAPNTPTLLDANSVAENDASGAVIGTVKATDQDAGDTVTLSISDTSDQRFEIVDGELKLKAGESLDFETEPTVEVEVTATDSQGLTSTQTFTITVDDVNEAPDTPTLVDANSVAENDATGAVIGTVTATDQDAGDTVTLSVSDPRFEIVDGQLKLKVDESLDFETEPTVTVYVTATDSAGLETTSEAFTITVDDVNEKATDILFGTSVVENAANEAEVETASVIDPDFGDSHTYALLDDADGRFTIDANSGVVTVADGTKLDYETATSHDVIIQVTDSGGLTHSETFTIEVEDVNEAPTAITLSNATVAAGATGAGGTIGTITVEDPDDPVVWGGHTLEVSDPNFEIVDGNLQLKEGVELSVGSYEVEVTATDDGGESTSQFFTIVAIGEIELSLADDMVSENLAGDVAGALLIDGAVNGDYTFAVENDPRFEIVNGELKLKFGESLDYETQSEMQVSIVVTNTVTNIETVKTVTVFVTDIDEVPGSVAPDGSDGTGGDLFDNDILIGGSVAAIGDVNDDGFADGIGFSRVDGTATVTYGSADGLSATSYTVTNLGALNYLNAQNVSVIGDINGDGIADMAFGDAGAGEVNVVFGQAGTAPVDVDASLLDGSNGFTISGSASGLLGYSVANAGDVNGDGIDDLIVGTSGSAGGEGAAYVLFGSADGWSDTFELTDSNGNSTLDGTNGFRIDSLSDGNGSFGYAVSGAGDINGDGIDDFMVGAWEQDPGGLTSAGQTYVVFGHVGGWDATINVSDSDTSDAVIDYATLDGSNGFRILGLGTESRSGVDVSVAGDVNGDGVDDLIIGAFGPDGTAAYVVYGSESGFGATVDVSTLDGTNGFTLDIAGDGWAGHDVTSAGDVNGDGFDDLIVTEPNTSAAYVVFGGPNIAAGSLSLADITTNSDLGFMIQGTNALGFMAAEGGDIDGDGFDDLIVTEYFDSNWNDGNSYVVYGGDFTLSVTGDITDAAGGTLEGTVVDDHLLGDAGDDVLNGNGGADVLYGGAGDDTLSVGDAGFMRIDGGGGFDTLALDNQVDEDTGLAIDISLDLTVIGDATIQGIEAIDMTGPGDNTLTLAMSDMLHLSDESSDLYVFGDAGDSIDLVGTWTSGGSVVVDGVAYNTYTVSGVDATLYVDTDLANPLTVV